ncbi:MAG: hypothetical protein N2444_04150 [Methylocystis sp.]|nr:hypothetical protein [Methylocystis sp.]
MWRATVTGQPGRAFCVCVGDIRIALHLADPALAEMIAGRYAGFLAPPDAADCRLDIETIPSTLAVGDPDEEVDVTRDGDVWRLSRGDFRAEWNIVSRRGYVRQTANPYSIDSVLRILHTLILAKRGGFLLHAASAVRNGKAHIFSGVSGAGKTTISRLAPPDATLLTDEISYVTKAPDGAYCAHGTPFAGDLGRPGENIGAPIGATYLISHGSENRIEDIASPVEAARALLGNILFFTHSLEMVDAVFESALEFVQETPVKRLFFLPEERIWTLIR